MTCQSSDLIASIIDEVALEGLDGITLQGMSCNIDLNNNNTIFIDVM